MTAIPRRPRVVFLFGPTAVGKTNLLSILPPQSIEIVSADSLQVYRGLDIGTAKPGRAFRDTLPHHLIDILDPNEQFDVGAFVHHADLAIKDILARGKLPIVSGGAGFYLRHLLFGLPLVPASTPAVRKRVQEKLQRVGLTALFNELRSVDPATADRLNRADEYRILRALEVFEATGKPLSAFPRPDTPREDIDVTLIELTRSRPSLHERINRRVLQMMDEGLRSEVERLVADGYGSDTPGLRGIGYREFFDPNGALRPEHDNEQTIRDIQAATRKYAKRQITFFRGLPNVTSLDADDTSSVVDLVMPHRDSPIA